MYFLLIFNVFSGLARRAPDAGTIKPSGSLPTAQAIDAIVKACDYP